MHHLKLQLVEQMVLQTVNQLLSEHVVQTVYCKSKVKSNAPKTFSVRNITELQI